MKNTSQSALAERLGVKREDIVAIHGELDAGVDFVETQKKGVEYSPAGAAKVETLLQVAPQPTHETPPEKKTAPPASGPQTWKATVVRLLPPARVFAQIDGRNVTVQVHASKCRLLKPDDVLDVVHYLAAQYNIHRYPARLGGGAK